jgi:hypothetical protein
VEGKEDKAVEIKGSNSDLTAPDTSLKAGATKFTSDSLTAEVDKQFTEGTDSRKEVETGFYVAKDKDGKKAVLHVKQKAGATGDQGDIGVVANSDSKVNCDSWDGENCVSPTQIPVIPAMTLVCKEEGGKKHKIIVEAASGIHIDKEVKGSYKVDEFVLDKDKIHTLDDGEANEKKKSLGDRTIKGITVADGGKLSMSVSEAKYTDCVGDADEKGGLQGWQIGLIVAAILAVVVVAVVMLMPSAEDEDDDEDDDDDDESDKNEP